MLREPLFGARYGEDGRTVGLTSDYTYTSWVPPKGNVEGYFGVADKVGVRAVSSVKRVLHDFEENIYILSDTAKAQNGSAADIFSGIVDNKEWMDTLARILGIHMTASLNTEPEFTNAEVNRSDVETMREMYIELVEAQKAEAEAIATLINLQYYLIYGGNKEAYNEVNADYVLSIPENSDKFDSEGNYVDVVTVGNATKNIEIKKLKNFLVDYNKLITDINALNAKLGLNADGTLIEGAVVKESFLWNGDGLSTIVERLMNVDECLIKKKSSTKYDTVENFTNNITDDTGLLLSLAMGNTVDFDIRVTNGVLYDMEKRVGTEISVSMLVQASMKISSIREEPFVAKIRAGVVTSAPSEGEINYFNQDKEYSESLKTTADENAGEITAEDTYAMVLDLWVRTNTDGGHLILEGALLRSEEVDREPVTIKDPYGNVANVYYVVRDEEEYDIYQAEDDVMYDYGNQTVEILPQPDDELEMQDTPGTVNGEQVPLYTLTRTVEAEDGTETTETYTVFFGRKVVWKSVKTHERFITDDNEEKIQRVNETRDIIGYQGVNRVWIDDEKVSIDSTTQGNGSCYIFYAENPDEQARSLKLLEAMEIAFIDREGNGNLLATAVLDTKNHYAENGRVIVPIVVSENGVAIGEGDETIYGITELTKNEARKISAIVYLNGDKVHNKDVLSADSIQGQLNIQFGTEVLLNPVDDTTLKEKTLSVSAIVNRTEMEFSKTGDMSVTVTADVEGDPPQKVEAFFLRQISESQGSKEPVMRFTDAGNGKWTATYNFTAPGIYLLRTIQIDGREYSLKDVQQVNVKGFAINSITCNRALDENRSFKVMTEDRYYDANITVKFASDDRDMMPEEVSGEFVSDDGTIVPVEFTYDPISGWTGRARFRVSGDYTFEYLIFDGKHERIIDTMQIHASIKLGMGVDIYTDAAATEFDFSPEDMPEELPMRVKIKDGSGNEMKGLGGVKLTYKLQGSSDALGPVDLSWNGAKGCYEGKFNTGEGAPGEWSFYNLEIEGIGYIYRANFAPSFFMRPTDPPEYVSVGNKDYTYAPSGNAAMTASLKHTQTATAVAIIYNEDSPHTKFEVQGVRTSTDVNSGISVWGFTIPKNTIGTNSTYLGKQDGNWVMEKIQLWNCCNEDNELIRAETDKDGILVPNGERDEPMEFVLDEERVPGGYKMTVVQTIKVTVTGPDENAFNGEFMQAFDVPAMEITIESFEGAVRNIGDTVSIVYTYQGDSEKYGGYSGAPDPLSDQSKFTVDFTKQDDVTFVSQKQTGKLKYAGTYKPTFSFTIGTDKKSEGSEGVEMTGEIPTFTVTTATPTVAITEIYPTGTINYDQDNSVDLHQQITVPAFTATSATVYFKCGASEAGSGTDCSPVYHNYTRPWVRITLSGIGKATNATLDFGSGVQIYNGTTQTTGYSWTADGVCERNIGYYASRTASTDTKTPAETITANRLVLTYNGVDYTVVLRTPITINNPD